MHPFVRTIHLSQTWSCRASCRVRRRRFGAGFARPIRLLLGATLLATCGACRTGGTTAGGESTPQAGLAEGEDPARAFTRLEDIQPAVERPQPREVKPLSGRGVEQLARAEALAAEERYTEAVLELERGLRYDARHPRLLAALARFHYRAGSLERARSSAASALEGDPTDPGLHLLVGRILTAQGRWEESLPELRVGVLLAEGAADDAAAGGWYDLAEALEHTGYLSAALGQYEKVDEWLARQGPARDPDLASRLSSTEGSPAIRRAHLLERLGRFADAAAQVERRIQSGDASSELRVRRTRLLMSAGRLEDAERALADVDSEAGALLDLLVELRTRQHREETVIGDLRARLRAEPDSRPLALTLLEAGQRLKRTQECVPDLMAFLRRVPDALDVRLRLLDVLAAAKRWEDLLTVGAEGIERDASCASAVAERVHAAAAAPDVDAILSAPFNPARPAMRFLRGSVAFRARRIEAAIAELSADAEATQALLPARRLLGEAYLWAGRWEDAQRAAARALPDVAQDPALEWIAGQAAEGLDDLAAAELHYKAGLQLDRTDERCMMALAHVYEATARELQYEEQLRNILQAHPLNTDAREALIVRYLDKDRIDEAARQLQELDKAAPTSSAMARCLAEVQQRQRADPAAIRKLLEEALQRNGPDPRTLIRLGDVLAAEGQYAASKQRYEEAARLDPRDPQAGMRLVGLGESLLEFESAAQRLKEVLARYPNRHALHLELIRVLTVVQQVAEALAIAEAQERRTDLTEAARTTYRERIIELLRLARRDDEAYRRLSGWASAEPGDGPWTRRWIVMCLEDDRAQEALTLAQKAYDVAEDKAAGELVINALIACGRAERALQMVLDWQEEDPTREGYAELLASKLALAERYDEAVELLGDHLPRATNPDRLRERMVRLQRAAGRHDDNVRFLEDWIADLNRTLREQMERRGMRPDRLQEGINQLVQYLHSWIVEELMLAGQYDAALLRTQQLLEMAPDAQMRFELFQLSYRINSLGGRMQEARQALEACHQLDPFDPGICNDLGYLLADQGQRLDEAERITRLAVARSPLNMAYLDSYGWVQYKKGDFESAYTWIRRAIGADRREDEVVFDHLGDAAWRTGRRQEAQEHWSLAARLAAQTVEQDPKDREAARVAAEAPRKVEAAAAGKEPAVAATAPAAASP